MIRVGVAGYGYWGPNLVRNGVEHEEIDVVRVCDMDETRLKGVKRRYPHIQTTTSFDDLLKSDIDAVIIATPVSTHAPLAMQALKAGKHVLIEKPIASTLKEAQELVDLSRKVGRILMVDHVFVYTPAVKKIKEICRQGQLGEIIYFDAVRTNLGAFQKDVNVIWDLAVHDVSIMQYILGQKPVSCSATGLSYFGNHLESIAYMTLFFPSNVIAHFHLSWASPVKVRTILLGGDKKMILYDDTQASEKIKVFDKGIDVVSKEKLHDLYISYRSGDVVSPKLENTEALKFMCDDFVRAIKTNTAPISDGNFSVEVIKVLEAASLSIKKRGQEIPIA